MTYTSHQRMLMCSVEIKNLGATNVITSENRRLPGSEEKAAPKRSYTTTALFLFSYALVVASVAFTPPLGPYVGP